MNKAGIDLGSRFVKIALLSNGELTFSRWDTAEFYKKHIERIENSAFINLESAGLPSNCSITATGYGRNLTSFSNAKIISEIMAHFKGAKLDCGEEDFVLLDIGGQDSKVIYSKAGYVEDFVMNDKCASSTGRFAENACAALGITLEELSSMTGEPAKLSSTCAVFCESEIISLLAAGSKPERIAAGINLSVAKRLVPLIKTYPDVTLLASGGAAKNGALLFFISELAGREISPVKNPWFNGAVGCVES